MSNRILPIPMGSGLNPQDVYTKEEVNALIQDFITNTVDDLVYYYDKTETYTQQEINSLIGQITSFEVVATLPTENIKTNVIYLLGPTGTGADKYDEYIYSNSTWVKIGETSIDLSNYVTDTELGTALAAKQDTLTAGTGITISSNVISATVNTEEIEHAVAAAINDTRDSIEQDLHNNYVKTQTMNDQLKNYTPKSALDAYSSKAYVDTAIGSVYAEIEDKERATSFALNDLEANKQDVLTAGTGITISSNVISADIPTLATVATTGNYADLSGTPTIPTVGTGVITLTSNGDTIGTFGLNDSDDKTIDIPQGGGSSNEWYGTMAQFNAISTKDPNTDYYISDPIKYSEISGTPNLSAYETKAASQAADQALDVKIAGKMNPIVFVGTGGIASIGTPLEGVTYAIEGETLPLTFTLDGIGTVTYNFVID